MKDNNDIKNVKFENEDKIEIDLKDEEQIIKEYIEGNDDKQEDNNIINKNNNNKNDIIEEEINTDKF